MDLVLRLAADFRILYASSAGRTILGFESRELLHQPVFSLVHPEDLAQAEAQRAALRWGEQLESRYRARCKNGSYILVEAQTMLFSDPGAGTPPEILMIWRTSPVAAPAGAEQQQIEQLRVERDDLHHTLMNVPAFMATLRGPEHVFEHVNERYYQLVGNRDLIGKPLLEALPEIVHQPFPALLDRVLRTGEPFEGLELPVDLQRLPGAPLEHRFVDLTYQPLRRPDGTVTGVLAHGVDVTEKVLSRRRLEVLRRIDQAIAAMETPERVAQAAMDHLIAFTEATGAALLLLDGEGTGQVLAGYPDDSVVWFADDDGRFPLALLAEAQFLRRGQTLYVTDMPARQSKLAIARGAVKAGIRSLLLIPLILQQERIGCLALASDAPRAFTPYMRSVAEETAKTLVITLNSARLLEQVQASREQLRRLSHRLVQVQEEERKHLALELHDQIGQQLLSIRLMLEQAMARTEPSPVHDFLEQASRGVEKLTNQVRALSLDLRPSLLDDLGLLAALSWYLHRYTEQTGITVEFKHAGLTDLRFSIELETTAYRIVQEALTNAGRHAGTDRVTVTAMVQGAMLLLRIEDYGAGFDPASVEASGGLSGMRERVALVGGEIVVETAPGAGVTILAGIPVTNARTDA